MATAESLFLVMKLVKTRLCNKMGDGCLTDSNCLYLKRNNWKFCFKHNYRHILHEERMPCTTLVDSVISPSIFFFFCCEYKLWLIIVSMVCISFFFFSFSLLQQWFDLYVHVANLGSASEWDVFQGLSIVRMKWCMYTQLITLTKQK